MGQVRYCCIQFLQGPGGKHLLQASVQLVAVQPAIHKMTLQELRKPLPLFL